MSTAAWRWCFDTDDDIDDDYNDENSSSRNDDDDDDNYNKVDVFSQYRTFGTGSTTEES